MKRSLVAWSAPSALAALVALCPATSLAQSISSVTLFGVVDVTQSAYRNQSDTPLGFKISRSQSVLTNSGLSSSRLGFRGIEDLGGGLEASFWLEAGINPDTGTGSGATGGLTFNRRSTVSLSWNFGELRLGRDYTPTYWNDNLFDPFGVNGVGTSLIATANGLNSPGSVGGGITNNTTYTRASNSIGYFLPPGLGGVYGQLMYAFNEQTSYDPGGLTPPGIAAIIADPTLAATGNDARAGRYVGGRLGYANGPLDIALAVASSTVGSNFFLGTTTSLDIWSVAGSYDFQVVKLFAEYGSTKQNISYASNVFNPFGVSNPGFDGVLLGLTAPVGPGLIRFAYSAVRYDNVNNLNFTNLNPDPKADKYALGYVYNLSKRTAIYGTIAYLSNKNGAGLTVGGPGFYVTPINGVVPVPARSVGYDLGLRHSF